LGFGVDIYSAADAKCCCLALLIVTITSRCNGCVGRGRGVEKGEKSMRKGEGKIKTRGSERRERERDRDRQREGAGGREVGRGRGGEKGGRESE
jgi:hypothetical protein